ncbi:hypothetical protein KMW28_27045 [Flammeovirga yaeyamensis]|uniref:Uncharacterized protein n=1 Tax=Flammeovirga yaeyamensis TaxID=367791 RepID=A0AAX1NAQ3_9BACT|nr:hypothetical protein [Flammeovirga yaeyamensis]MBB3700065.1 hypothetical protein [Flammeovirga yaeyamensis]NMF37500.1 hypothetical protein [Flammeovirga yaeyamensis]QWG04557.1 hypothetical protein KMW28_27045 [Flammeovirga yaeyamensis]
MKTLITIILLTISSISFCQNLTISDFVDLPGKADVDVEALAAYENVTIKRVGRDKLHLAVSITDSSPQVGAFISVNKYDKMVEVVQIKVTFSEGESYLDFHNALCRKDERFKRVQPRVDTMLMDVLKIYTITYAFVL